MKHPPSDSGVQCPSCGGEEREVRGDNLVCVSPVERRAPGIGWHYVRGADMVAYRGLCCAVVGSIRTPPVDEPA